MLIYNIECLSTMLKPNEGNQYEEPLLVFPIPMHRNEVVGKVNSIFLFRYQSIFIYNISLEYIEALTLYRK